MFLTPLRRAMVCSATLASFLVVGCGPDSPTDPAKTGGPAFAAADLGAGNGLANFEFIEVCKYGSTADVTVDMTQASSGNTSVTYSFADGECRNLGNFDATVGLGPADITASESNIPTGFQFDSLRTTIVGRNGASGSVNVSTTNSFAILGADNDIGILLEFYNSEIPSGGGEGCTPGYWKQSQHFDSWVPTGFLTTQTAGSVFSSLGAACPTLAGKTLVDSLQGGGGANFCKKVRILTRAAVAAVLNAAHLGVSYPRTVADIQAAVKTAIASGNS